MSIKAGDKVVHVSGSWSKPETVVEVRREWRPLGGMVDFAFFEGGGWWRVKALVVVADPAHDVDGCDDAGCMACNGVAE